MNATQLANELGLDRSRISQLVAQGRLNGCYHGAGKQRVFDPAKCAAALEVKLDRLQMMGNGRDTRAALRTMAEKHREAEPAAADPPPDVQKIPPGQPDLFDAERYEIARTQKVEEEARRLRRMNAEAEGHYLLASDVSLQVRAQLAQEIKEFESVLRDGARAIADQMGVDFKTARQILVDRWRAHRAGRSDRARAVAESAEKTQAEIDEDI